MIKISWVWHENFIRAKLFKLFCNKFSMDPFTEREIVDAVKSIASSLKEMRGELKEIKEALEDLSLQYELAAEGGEDEEDEEEEEDAAANLEGEEELVEELEEELDEVLDKSGLGKRKAVDEEEVEDAEEDAGDSF